VLNDSNRDRLPALTSLRFFAAFHVFLFHIGAMGAIFGPLWFQRISSIGYVGVSFFFVLSGFILVYTYAGRPMNAKNFWQARFARVYPAYAFSLLLTLPFFLWGVFHFAEIKLPFLAFQAAHAKMAALFEILLLQSWIPPAALSWNSVGWSLSVEAFFYAIFPWLLGRVGRLSRRGLLLSIALCWLASNAISLGYTVLRPDGLLHPGADVYTGWMNVVKFFPLARVTEFLMGMAAGFLFLKHRSERSKALPFVATGAAMIAIVAALAAKLPYAVIHTALLSPAFTAIVYGIALRPRWSAILEARPLVLLGEASYSMYLIHANFVFPFFHDNKGALRNANFLGLAMCLTLVVAVSLGIYAGIERPARRKLRPRAAEAAKTMAATA